MVVLRRHLGLRAESDKSFEKNGKLWSVMTFAADPI